MSDWIFQVNPDNFDITANLQEEDDILWEVRQKRFAPKIRLGDTIFVWRAAGTGKRKTIPGVIALARITEEPRERPEDEASRPFYVKGFPTKEELRVKLHVEKKFLGDTEVVRKDWLMEDPVLAKLTIISMCRHTNYEVPPPQADRLRHLCNNAGRN